MEKEQKAGLSIQKRTFVSVLILLLALLIAAGILTRVLPQGSYERVNVDGQELVVPDSYRENPSLQPLPIWRWFTAPFEVLASPDSVLAIGIMVFLTLVGGTFAVLEKSGVLRRLMAVTIRRFGNNKYRMTGILLFVFMALGSAVGIFEEGITLVPIAVAISFSMGWDSLVGLGLSAFSIGMGFAAGTFNPFTVAVAQQLADVPVFSGLSLRALVFVFAYAILAVFMITYAKRIEKDPKRSLTYEHDLKLRERYMHGDLTQTLEDPRLKKALNALSICLGIVFLYILAGFIIKPLTDYTLIVMALLFTLAGFLGGKLSGYGGRVTKDFFSGCLSVLPAVAFILLAMGVKHVITAGGILDTILFLLSGSLKDAGPYASALLMFFIVLVLEIFIASGSAKAFLLIPLIVPLADLSGVSRQTVILAYVLGDGFSNMIYPTNTALLIMLGIADISYGKWFRWVWKPLIAILLISVGVLCLAVATGY